MPQFRTPGQASLGVRDAAHSAWAGGHGVMRTSGRAPALWFWFGKGANLTADIGVEYNTIAWSNGKTWARLTQADV